jgi:glutamine---fructose-6-phosphate transaminase (isomerizing)
MENKLWADIQAQGANLTAVVEHLYSTERGPVEAAGAFVRNERPLALIGVASAQYLCKTTVNYLNQHGRPASDWCAGEAVYSMLPALRSSNVIINSRSGETAEVVKLCQLLAAEDIPYVLITNEQGSTAARLARHVIWANTRKDELVSINVVSGMMLATLALAAAVVGELDALRPKAEQLARVMAEVVQRASQQAAEIGRFFAGVRPIYLLYRGASSGAAYCGRLVLEEVARQPAIAIGAAEFRQGANEVIDERFGAVLFIPGGKQGELNLKLAADIQNSGGRVLLVGQVNAPVTGRPTELLFPILDLPDTLSPVVEVVPVQLLAYELARAQGYEPGQVRFISKVILSEEGIPNQG